MLETFLGDTDENGCIGCVFFRCKRHIHHTERESRKRLVSSSKQAFNEFLAAQTL
jgi:hypothetical protein